MAVTAAMASGATGALRTRLGWTSESRQPLQQYFRVAGALVILLPAQGRKVVGGALDELGLGLEIGERLGRQRQQLAQPQFTRPVFHELNQLAPDSLIL